MNYYKRHLGDYAKDTKALTTYQHGVYAVLLDWYYSQEKPIPVGLVYRICQARSGPEKRACDEVLAMCFDLCKAPGFAHNKRADEDIAKYISKAQANSLIAQERESTKRARVVVETCNESTTNDQPSHKPLATSHKEQEPKQEQRQRAARVELPEPPDWLDAEAWAGFVDMRRRERHPLTPKAASLVIAKLTRFREQGVDTTASLNLSILNGYRDVFEPRESARAGTARTQQPMSKTAAAYYAMGAVNDRLNESADLVPDENQRRLAIVSSSRA